MKIRPMRGIAPTRPLDGFPYYASPKIDGIRMWVKDGVVLSKTGKPIPNQQVQKLFGHLHGADGEGTVGPAHKTSPDDDVFDRSRGAIMRRDCEADFQFHVFDVWDRPSVTTGRRAELVWDRYYGSVVDMVVHTPVHSQKEVDTVLEIYLDGGYEGAMLRRVDGFYKAGQSTEREGYLLKLKPFADSTAVVIGFGEQMENTNEAVKDELGYTKRSSAKVGKVGKGTLGYFVVKDLVTGAIFEVGNGKGVTAEFRQNVWDNKESYAGMCLDYSYQAIGTKDKPRLPQFLRWRDRMDISELEDDRG